MSYISITLIMKAKIIAATQFNPVIIFPKTNVYEIETARKLKEAADHIQKSEKHYSLAKALILPEAIIQVKPKDTALVLSRINIYRSERNGTKAQQLISEIITKKVILEENAPLILPASSLPDIKPFKLLNYTVGLMKSIKLVHADIIVSLIEVYLELEKLSYLDDLFKEAKHFESIPESRIFTFRGIKAFKEKLPSDAERLLNIALQLCPKHNIYPEILYYLIEISLIQKNRATAYRHFAALNAQNRGKFSPADLARLRERINN